MRGRMAGMVALAWAKRQIKGMDLNPTTVAVGVVALGVASAAASWAEARRTAGVLKMTAATGYLGLALMGGALGTGYGRAILAALILCWIGDLLLIAPGRGAAFLGGLGSFLVGHLAFAWAFHVHGVDYGWLTAGGVAASTVGLSVSRWLAAHDVPQNMKTHVGLYIGAITVMVAMAVGSYGADAAWVIPVGAVTFMASDLFVARERFVVSSPMNVSLGLPLYFLAQVLLALSV